MAITFYKSTRDEPVISVAITTKKKFKKIKEKIKSVQMLRILNNVVVYLLRA